jgi:hypothetical protein
MVVLFSDGQVGSTMETAGDFSAWTGTALNGDAAISNISPHHGANQAKFYTIQLAGAYAYAYKNLGAAYATLYMRAYVFIDSKPATATFYDMGLIFQKNSSITDLAKVIFNPNTNKWGIRADVGGLTNFYEAGTSTVNVNTYYCTEARITVSAAAGILQLWIDGVLKVNESALNTGATNLQYPSLGVRYNESLLAANIALGADCVVVADAYIGPEAAASAFPQKNVQCLGSRRFGVR